MGTDLKGMIEAARITQDALWAQLNEIEGALVSQMATFLASIGLKEVKPFICDCCGPGKAMELTWLLEEEGGKEVKIEEYLHEPNLLFVLFNEPQTFHYLDTDSLKCSVRDAAAKLSLDLEMVASFLDEHAMMITLENGVVELREVILTE